MKKYLYVICLVAAFGGLISCSKNNDPAPDPLVGTWKLDRVRTSGFLAPYAANNGDNDPTVLDYQDTFITKVDKTFTGTVRTSGQVIDYSGNWESTASTLTLNDTQGNKDTYTLDATKTPNQLLGIVSTGKSQFKNPTTSKTDTLTYSVQLIYAKQ